jgi:hypothetical protein
MPQKACSRSPTIGQPATESGGGGISTPPWWSFPARSVADSTRLVVIMTDGTASNSRMPATRITAESRALPPSATVILW